VIAPKSKLAYKVKKMDK